VPYLEGKEANNLTMEIERRRRRRRKVWTGRNDKKMDCQNSTIVRKRSHIDIRNRNDLNE
jgi:hypothetical protein